MQLIAGLYIVSTPIGNLEDITIRAIKILKNSSIILCEDTRIARKLLIKYNINTPLMVYNEHSSLHIRYKIQKLIESGKILSLISDSGTPLIADPGYKLVRYLQDQKKYHIDVLPGASSVLSALILSGLATDKFLFAGFIPKTIKAKENFFLLFKDLVATLIFFESPHRLISSLNVAKEILGNREAVIVKEITKIFQTTKAATLQSLITHYSNNLIKGEIVILISGKYIQINNLEDIKHDIHALLSKGNSAKTTVTALVEKYKTSYSKQYLYNLVNKIK